MTKFLTLCAAFLVFLVSTVAAMPQEHLAPSVHSKESSNALEARGVIRDQLAEAGNNPEKLHERQVHNADYGSDSGPSGNPQTAQQTTEQSSSATAAAAGSESTSAASDTAYQAKRQDVETDPTDVDYAEDDS